MYAIFIQSHDRLKWFGNEPTIELAKIVAESLRKFTDVDFVIVTPLAHFVDVDGERDGGPAD